MNIHPMRADYFDVSPVGYEYIPPDFVPVRLPHAVEAARRIIFGAKPDGLFCGLRAQELLTYIHETELAEYAYKLDSRVTYWPELKESRYALDKKKIVIAQTTGGARRIVPSGSFQASLTAGTAYRNYAVIFSRTNDDNPTFFARAQMLEPPYEISTIQAQSPSIPLFQLPQNSVSLKIAESGVRSAVQYLMTENEDNLIVEYFVTEPEKIILETPINILGIVLPGETVIARWNVSTQARPPDVITTLLPAIEMLGEPIFLELFGVAPEEPYTTFRNLWFDHPLPTYRLAGLALAIIYRTEEARKNG